MSSTGDLVREKRLFQNELSVIVSNPEYNHYFNIVIIVPISFSKKFLTEQRFKESPHRQLISYLT